jgi:hypothetical protein
VPLSCETVALDRCALAITGEYPGVSSLGLELWSLTEDELLDRIDSCDRDGWRVARDAALEELFARLREQPPPEDPGAVERVIAYIRSAFAGDDADDDGPGSAGVREPRRPPPQSDGASAWIAPRTRADEVA